MCHRLTVRFTLTLLVLLGVCSHARAQGYISPFVGFNFGGDSSCAAASNCKDKTSNLGVAVGTSHAVVGFEEEFGYARHFFGAGSPQSGSVLTLMSNFVIGPHLGLARPYALIGAGIIKSHVDLSLTDIATSDTSFGWNIGGGLELGGAHLGVRGDVRYIHGFQDVGIPGIGITDLKLDFGRASAGLVLRF